MTDMEYAVHNRHEFDPETLDALGQIAARPEPTKAQWRCAAAEILARQPWRRGNVDKLIEDAGVLARWLEYGWAEKE